MWRRNLYAAWVAQVLSVSGFGFVMPFIPFYIQELGVTDPDQLRLWTGLLSSGPALTMAVMAPVWGLVADRFGKKLMILRAMLFGSIIIALLATTRSVRGVLVLRICQGLFSGTVTASAALVAAGTPRNKLSYALGMLSSSTFVGISIGPAIGGMVAEQIGYRASFLIAGGMLAVGFVFVLLLVREADLPEPEQDSGSGHELQAKAANSRRATSGRGPLSILTGSMVGLFVLILMLRFVRTLPVPFLPLFIQELRGQLAGSASATGWISAARGLVTAIAAITLTRFGDRYPRLVVLAVLLAVAGIFSLPLFFADSLWFFSIFFVVATFFLGGVEPLVQAELSSQVPPARRGLLFGIQTSIANLGWFAAPLVGSFVSIRLGIPHIFLILAICLFLTVAVVALVHYRRSGRLQA